MKRIFKILLIFIFIFTSITTVFADEVITPDSNVIMRAYPCDECGAAMVASSKTMSILKSQVLIPCGCVYGTPGWGDDWKLTYDVYNTYVCSSCGYTIPRTYLSPQTKYYCIEADRYYNPATGQSIEDDYFVENHNDCLDHEHILSPVANAEELKVVQNEEFVILGEVCSECNRGSLLASNDLILSDDYTVTSRTVPCIEFPSFRVDQVWRYYFYNTYKCNYCGALYERAKTSYYEEWGFCSHGGGKYPLNVINKGLVLGLEL